MSTVEQQVVRARRRLNANILFERLALGVLVGASAWAVLLLVERAFVLSIPVGQALWVAAAAAAAVALVGTYLVRVSDLQAAVAVDAAAGLKERVSTALVLGRDDDPFARLAVSDAEQVAGQVHVPTHLPYRAPAMWPWSAALVAVAALLAFFMPELNLLAEQDDDDAQLRQEAQVEHQAIKRELDARLNELKQMTDNNPALADLAEDLKPLELPDEPTMTPEDIRREAARRIDNVAEKLAAQQESAKLDALKDTKRMLSQMKPQGGQQAGSKLSQSLAQGDFKGARKAIEELKNELEEAAAKGDAEAQQKLQQMQNQLRRLADQLAKLDDATYLRKELENKAGLSEEDAKKLLEQLSKMDPKQMEKELQRQLGEKGMSQEQIKQLAKKFQQKQEAKKSCQNMGQCLAQAAQALQQCNKPGSGSSGADGASAALADAADQLSELEMSEQMMNELEAQLGDLRDMRESICQGSYGRCEGQPGAIGQQGPNYGRGIGSRIPKERAAHALQPTRVKSRGQGGTIIGQKLVDGPQMRGEASAAVRETLTAAQRDALDAVERDEVPRQYHDAVRQYFDRLAGLMNHAEEPPSPEPDAVDPEK